MSEKPAEIRCPETESNCRHEDFQSESQFLTTRNHALSDNTQTTAAEGAASERWLPIAGFEQLYEVSDLGRVRHMRTKRLLRPAIVSRLGHQQVKLSREGKPHDRLVHRLVLEAFVGPCPAGMHARHVHDPNPANNALSNLAWGTQSENEADKKRHGTLKLKMDRANVTRRARRARGRTAA